MITHRRKLRILYLFITSYASCVPMVHRAFTAAYVDAKCGYCPGPPPKPPAGD